MQGQSDCLLVLLCPRLRRGRLGSPRDVGCTRSRLEVPAGTPARKSRWTSGIRHRGPGCSCRSQSLGLKRNLGQDPPGADQGRCLPNGVPSPQSQRPQSLPRPRAGLWEFCLSSPVSRTLPPVPKDECAPREALSTPPAPPGDRRGTTAAGGRRALRGSGAGPVATHHRVRHTHEGKQTWPHSPFSTARCSDLLSAPPGESYGGGKENRHTLLLPSLCPSCFSHVNPAEREPPDGPTDLDASSRSGHSKGQ